jgi:hypothetical protein
MSGKPVKPPATKNRRKIGGVDDFSMKDVFKICLKTSSDSSAKWFQYRIYAEFFLLVII